MHEGKKGDGEGWSEKEGNGTGEDRRENEGEILTPPPPVAKFCIS